MISTRGSPPGRSIGARGLGDRPHLQAVQSPGRTSPRRTPRMPSIGFDSCSRSTAASRRRSPRSRFRRCSSQRHPDRQLGQVGQELVQRRVEQPDGDRQAVHRLEDPDEVLALQRQQLLERGLARPRRSRRGSAARRSCLRSPRNMCSVRHSPMPSAPIRRARAASSAVSALARTPSRRRSSACIMIRSTAPTSVGVVGCRSARLDPGSKYCTTGDGTHGHLAAEDLAGRCRRSRSRRPPDQRCAVRRVAPARTASISRSSAPHTRACPCRVRRPRRATSCRRGW